MWLYHSPLNNPISEHSGFSRGFATINNDTNILTHISVYIGPFIAVRSIPREGLPDQMARTLQILIDSAVTLSKRLEVISSPTNSL